MLAQAHIVGSAQTRAIIPHATELESRVQNENNRPHQSAPSLLGPGCAHRDHSQVEDRPNGRESNPREARFREPPDARNLSNSCPCNTFCNNNAELRKRN